MGKQLLEGLNDQKHLAKLLSKFEKRTNYNKNNYVVS